MDIRNQIKQTLRMCGHAAVSTVHDRLNVMDQQLATLQDQNTSLARSQTALLQSCVHVVETLQHLQKQFQTDSDRVAATLAQLQKQEQSIQDGIQQRIEQAVEYVTNIEQSHAALLQSSIHLVEKLGAAQAEWEGQAESVKGVWKTAQQLLDVQQSQWALIQSCADAIERLRQDTDNRFQEMSARDSDAAHTLQRSINQLHETQVASCDVSRHVEDITTTVSQELRGHTELMRTAVCSLDQIREGQTELMRTAVCSLDQIRESQAAPVQEAQGDIETEKALECLSSAVQACLNSVSELHNEHHVVFDQHAGLRQELQKLSSQSDDVVFRSKEIADRVGGLHHYTQALLEEELVRQICVETSDYDFTNPEVGLMSFLYSHLPTNKVLDIGAHVGDVSERLLKAGFEVWGFEPYPATYKTLTTRLGGNKTFHPFNFALGRVEADLPLHVAKDLSQHNIYNDATVFNSLNPHSMPDDLPFSDSVIVPVKTVAKLHDKGLIPEDISMAKIDTEGYDLEVVRGMGKHRYPVVGIEFWDTRIPFGKSGLLYTFTSAVAEMRQLGYPWYVVLYRIWGRNQTAFYCNHNRSVPESWGNVFFFQTYDTFSQAQAWCSAVLPRTYFKSVPSKQSV